MLCEIFAYLFYVLESVVTFLFLDFDTNHAFLRVLLKRNRYYQFFLISSFLFMLFLTHQLYVLVELYHLLIRDRYLTDFLLVR